MRKLSLIPTLVVGMVLLALSLAKNPSTDRFYVLSIALAAVWIVGGLVAGVDTPEQKRRSPIPAVLVGVLTFLVFLVGDLVVRLIPPLHDQLRAVVGRADSANMWIILAITIVNGIGEELFFRGALFSALRNVRGGPVIATTIVYGVVTACAWNALLLFAGLLMGLLWAVERKVSRGIRASALSHVVWSALIVLALPR